MKWRDTSESMGAMAYPAEALAANGVAGQHMIASPYNYRLGQVRLVEKKCFFFLFVQGECQR